MEINEWGFGFVFSGHWWWARLVDVWSSKFTINGGTRAREEGGWRCFVVALVRKWLEKKSKNGSVLGGYLVGLRKLF
ncbi:hypothetical protein KY284_035899 [Solanum tuberosum]|nr:hypothetical protein KY284_035899 [Solanum tuberosum]